MMTPTRTEELLRRMLERRAEVPPPVWLLPSVAQAARATPQVRQRPQRAAWLPRPRSERLVLVAAVAALLLALVVGGLIAGGVIVRTPKSPLSAIAIEPSASASGSSDRSASPSGTLPPPGPGQPEPPANVIGSAWKLSAGLRYEVVCEDGGSDCRLHLFDAAGRDQDGWPVALPGDCDTAFVAVGPEEAAFVACSRDGRAIVTGLDRSGNALPGWPVSLKGRVAESVWNAFAGASGWPSIAVGPDATVFVATEASGDASYSVHALGSDGATRSGWPIELAGSDQGFRIAPDGAVVAWWYEDAVHEMQLEARRTVFTEIGQDGRVRSGWPRGSAGAASGPVVWGDGSLFYVSAGGKVWGHDRGGEIIEGWPYELAYPVAPTVRSDGTLMFIEESRVVVLDRVGEAVPGWPYRTKGRFTSPAICDTGDFSLPLATVAADETLYLASWDGDRSSVVALGPDGAMAGGWPYRPPAGWRVGDLSFDADGTLRAFLVGESCGFDATSIELDARGNLVGDALPTPLTLVYEAMRLEGLRTTSGKDTFDPGAQIDFEVALANRWSGAVTLPHVDHNDKAGYAAGSIQTWIEPLVPVISYSGPPYPCLPPFPRPDSDWYATGGWILISSDPVSIQPGGSMAQIETSLAPESTGCLTPGEYRYRVEYKRLDASEEDEAIDEATFLLTIVAPAPVVTPTPSPPPPPTPAPSPFPSG